MLFNSIDFAVFLPVVFLLYWFVTFRNLRLQNGLIVAASYVFYGWWDFRFLSLILISTLVDYLIGLRLAKEDQAAKRKALLWTSILVNLGFLGFFKYYNFFLENLVESFTFFGLELEASSLNIILPVGISFYTFQTLSYTIDVYKRKLEPTRDFVAFAAFVSFFPQLVAGPIERASHLLPQFYEKRSFDYKKATDGMRQILWGLFKKMVVADNCAEFANQIFNNSSDYSGGALVVGAIFFAFQIYCDFSGYSDIAIGTSRLFGFDLMRNFAFPYFSRDIAEFWRRWHISLSTWFRDYLYIPLGGSRGGNWMKARNIFVIFIVSGFWHGANWTFIIWGLLNALYFLPLMLTNNNRNHIGIVAEGGYLPSVKELFFMFSTFCLTVFAWIFFRAENLAHAWQYITGIIKNEGLGLGSVIASDPMKFLMLSFFIALLLLFEWISREKEFGLQIQNMNKVTAWGLYLFLFSCCLLFSGSKADFIYFQF